MNPLAEWGQTLNGVKLLLDSQILLSSQLMPLQFYSVFIAENGMV